MSSNGEIQHKHIMIRAECKRAPHDTLEGKMDLNTSLSQLVQSIGMKICLPARCTYIDVEDNEGYTGNIGLSTSHAAYHWWDTPDPKLLTHKGASLVQFDLYTCGCLDGDGVLKCLQWIDRWGVLAVEVAYLDRAHTLADIRTYYESGDIDLHRVVERLRLK